MGSSVSAALAAFRNRARGRAGRMTAEGSGWRVACEAMWRGERRRGRDTEAAGFTGTEAAHAVRAKIRRSAGHRPDFPIDQGIPSAFSGGFPMAICSSARESLHNSTAPRLTTLSARA